ncbi:MAG: GTPase Era [Clostridiales bacterium]|jgi:GTP-binding protein Era|nr:GTPase Era [Clostridiales bacterium]
MSGYKSGFVSIVGRPNVGKSTLLNGILGEKVAAVSPKPQTTRTRVTGVVTDDAAQIVFVDTPGIHEPKNKLGKFMVQQAERGAGDSDVMLYMIDASRGGAATDGAALGTLNAPCVFLVVNKTDKTDKPALLPIIAEFSHLRDFAEILPVSALRGDGVGELVETIKKYLPEGPKFFPDDTLTDQPERQICGEFVREKMLRLLDDEIPYGTAVVVEEMTFDAKKPLTSVSAVIYCERESHKAIIIGKNGAMLKKIGAAARRDMERFTGAQVFLRLWVKVQENWRNSDVRLKNFGYRD